MERFDSLLVRRAGHVTSTLSHNTIQKSLSIVFCGSAIPYDSSLNKYRKQKQSLPGNTQNGARLTVYGTC
jgi:hypothetical protein